MLQIDSTNRFLLQMREQISGAAAAATGRTRKTAGAAKPRSAGIHGLIIQRVLALDPADPDRRRKAFRLFLESVLVDELGSDLLTAPGYHQVVERVYRAMEANPALTGAIDQAGEFLLSEAKQR